MDELGVLRDAHPSKPFEVAQARDAARAKLMAALSAERAPSRRRSLGRRSRLLIAVALAAGVSALVLVPIGGASLGSRTVHEINSMWEPPANGIEPANQPALDRAADDAQSIAGGAYFTEDSVDDAANTVDVYLASAPQSVIDQLEAAHPGTYVIHNDAAHPLSELVSIQHSLPLGDQGDGFDVVEDYPTSEGYLRVGVQGHTDVQTAQAALDARYGPGIIKVYGGAQQVDTSGYHG